MEKVLKSNLEIALWTAIQQRTKVEKGWGYTMDSALLGGWKSNLKALQENNLKIKYDE